MEDSMPAGVVVNKSWRVKIGSVTIGTLPASGNAKRARFSTVILDFPTLAYQQKKVGSRNFVANTVSGKRPIIMEYGSSSGYGPLSTRCVPMMCT
jgi:hypothetical protein